MAYKIYTKTGDSGSTSLFGGMRLPKSHIRIEAYGTIDELNAFTGLLRDLVENDEVKEFLTGIQNTLFNVGSNLAVEPGKSMPVPPLEEASIHQLEQAIDHMEEELPPLKNFVLPGGHSTVSVCHVARTVCRRAERATVALSLSDSGTDGIFIRYLNRLSDYFFVLSRKLAKDLGAQELLWKPS